MADLFANSRNTGQTPPYATSYQGLHYLPVILFGVSKLKWVNEQKASLILFVIWKQIRTDVVLVCVKKLRY